MKKWNEAEVVELELKATAFGPHSPNSVDEVKQAVQDEQGNVLGWKEQYGEAQS